MLTSAPSILGGEKLGREEGAVPEESKKGHLIHIHVVSVRIAGLRYNQQKTHLGIIQDGFFVGNAKCSYIKC